jgi:lipoate-protein ligase B
LSKYDFKQKKGQREVLRGTEASFIFIFDHSAIFTFGTYMKKMKKKKPNKERINRDLIWNV